MVYKIAFASSDGVRVDSHFGSAERFYIVTLDTEKEEYDITGQTEVRPPCNGGWHEVSKFGAVLEQLNDVSAIVAQRVGPGAKKYIEENYEALLFSIIKMQDHYISRISHPEPGMPAAKYYKDLKDKFNAEIDDIVNQINSL